MARKRVLMLRTGMTFTEGEHAKSGAGPANEDRALRTLTFRSMGRGGGIVKGD